MEHLTEVTQQLPPAKLARKKRSTILGVALVVLGGVMSLASFIAPILLIQGGMVIDKWAVMLACLPFAGGLLLAIVGANVASGELVSAALKDVGAMLRVWRRNGAG